MSLDLFENKILNEKLSNLKKIIENYKRAAVAFSGGVDSTFLLYMVNSLLNKSDFIAVTVSSIIRKPEELDKASLFAKKFDIEIIKLETNEIIDDNFRLNKKDRCYHCKKNIYSNLLKLSEERNIPYIFDGTNSDDLNEYRPGLVALKELNIKTPLAESKLNKSEIRELSKKFGLQTWNDISDTCLATRIEYGIPINEMELKKVLLAENFLSNLGFKGFRVRNHLNIARIEFLKDDIKTFFDSEYVTSTDKYFKEIGFKWVTVDIIGYKSGSLNI